MLLDDAINVGIGLAQRPASRDEGQPGARIFPFRFRADTRFGGRSITEPGSPVLECRFIGLDTNTHTSQAYSPASGRRNAVGAGTGSRVRETAEGMAPTQSGADIPEGCVDARQ